MSTIQSLHQTAISLLNKGHYQQAHPFLVKIIEECPTHADSYFLLGVINIQVGQISKAVALIEKALKFDSKIEYVAQLARAYTLTGAFKAAKKLAVEIEVSVIRQGQDADTIGVALSHCGEHELALRFFTRAIEINDSTPQFFYNFGVSAKFVGAFSDAKEAFENAIRLQPDHYPSHFALSDLLKATKSDNRLPRLKKCFERLTTPEGKLQIGHALAKEYQDLNDYEQAYNSLVAGKAMLHSVAPYDHQRSQSIFESVRYLSNQYQSSSQSGIQSKEPIFVVGMPRSGTTLVERILSSHSKVMSAGELQDFGMSVKRISRTASSHVLDVETLNNAYKADFKALGQMYLDATRVVTGTHQHFVDKLPFNFFYVDLIRKALPNAKIICLMRDPLDTCIGNFRQLFTIHNPNYAYSLNLKDTAQFYARFYQLIQFWKSRHGSQFYTLQYESLVANPHHEINELLDFCELPFENGCIDFHTNDAPVSTASKVQVREPLNTKSIGRWKKFKPFTNEIEQYLKEQSVI